MLRVGRYTERICDLCRVRPPTRLPANLARGQWAYLCEPCHGQGNPALFDACRSDQGHEKCPIVLYRGHINIPTMLCECECHRISVGWYNSHNETVTGQIVSWQHKDITIATMDVDGLMPVRISRQTIIQSDRWKVT